jgi:hypothetical protein
LKSQLRANHFENAESCELCQQPASDLPQETRRRKISSPQNFIAAKPRRPETSSPENFVAAKLRRRKPSSP